jgi:hypothetical protein
MKAHRIRSILAGMQSRMTDDIDALNATRRWVLKAFLIEEE